MAGISIGKLLIIGAVVVLLFGTKKLSSLGADLGSAIKGFKKAMNEDESGQNNTVENTELAIGRTKDKADC